jgi:signal transduction histidine kinase
MPKPNSAMTFKNTQKSVLGDGEVAQQSDQMSQRTHILASIFRRGIRRSMMIWGLGLFGVALAVNTLTGSIYTRLQIQRSTAALQTEVAILIARHVESYIAQKIERLRDAASNMSLYSLGSEEQRVIIGLLLKNDQSFQEISILNDQGLERLRMSDRKVYFAADLRDLRNYAPYENAITGLDYVSQVYTSNRAEPYLFLALPVTNPMKKRVGVAIAQSSMKFLWELVRNEKFGRAGVIYLVNEKGKLIAHRNPLRVLENPNLENLPTVAEFLRGQPNRQATVTRGRGLSGEDVLSTYAVVPRLGWGVVVEEPVAFALADLKKLEFFTKILMLAGLLMGAIIIVFLSNRITGPILKLRDGANIIEQGNLNHRVQIDTNDELGELGAKFNQMANALKNSYETLETKVNLRTRDLSALYGVTTLINQSLDLQTVFNYGIQRITELFRFETIRFFLFDDLLETLTLSASYNTNQATLGGVGPIRRGESVVGRVAETGEPAIFEDIQSDPRYFAWSQSKTNYKAGFHFLAAMPIKSKTHVFGVAAFSSKESRQLTDDDVKLLNAICEQIAVAVEKSRLFDEITKRSEAVQKANEVLRNEITERHRAQQEVLRQHQRLRSLHEIGAAINSTLDKTHLLEVLFGKIESFLPHSAASVCLIDNTTNQLTPTAQRDLEPELWSIEGPDYADSPALRLSAKVIEQKAPMVIENVRLDERRALFEPWIKHGWTGIAGLPLMAEGEVVGSLTFYSREDHIFAKEEIEFLVTLAGQLATAILNSQLYEKSQQQATDLEKANKAKDEFLNVMSHELRTPLSVIGGYAQVMSSGIAGEPTAEQREIADKINSQSNELLRMINEILQVGSLQAGSVRAHFESTNLNDLVKKLKSIFDVMPRRPIALNWEIPADMPTVNTDGDKLKHILQNLVHNAIKFTDDGCVTVSVRCLADSIEFEVKDTGVGIEKDMLPVIFDMFRQVDSSQTRSHGGVGVGLFIVKKYVELINGKIEIESAPGRGTTFTLTIPADGFAEAEAQPLREQFARLIA